MLLPHPRLAPRPTSNHNLSAALRQLDRLMALTLVGEEERSSAVLSESSLSRSFASPSSGSEDWRRFINLSAVARECIISLSSSCREEAFCVRCEMFTENVNCALSCDCLILSLGDSCILGLSQHLSVSPNPTTSAHDAYANSLEPSHMTPAARLHVSLETSRALGITAHLACRRRQFDFR